MRIKEIKIKNFRSIIECNFELNNLLALVGKNNNGKSNIIDGVEMLLHKNKVNSVYDFNDKTQPIEIESLFVDLTEFEKEKLKDYMENDNLKLKKVFNYKEKDNEEPDSESKMYFIKKGKDIPTKAKNIIIGEMLPEFYKIPAVKDFKEESKIVGTTYFGKFLNLVFESSNSDFDNLDKILEEIKMELERTDEKAPLIKSAKEIENIMHEQFKDCKLEFKIETPKRKNIINQLEVFVNDGYNTPLLMKGHGIQRAFIFSILLLYAKKLNNKINQIKGKNKKDIIIAIEEPEIYLHPQQQKIIYELFKKLILDENDQIQIIYTTHSSFMINVWDYKFLGFVSKKQNIGTKITQCVKDIFDNNEKKEFQIVCQFDPERNEMFFADKIILCEGDTEKYSIPVIFDKMDLDFIEKRITIVECGSKNGIPLFQKILNKFNETEQIFDYIVFHDLDIPPKKYKNNKEKKDLETQSNKINTLIADLLNIDKIFIFNPDFERYLSLPEYNDSKPYNCRKELIKKTVKDIPIKLLDFINKYFKY